MFPPGYVPLIALTVVFPISQVSALQEVSGVLTVHHSLNLTRMHYHMRFWKEELSSLPTSLAELPRLMLEHKRGELSMLTRTLLKEARLDAAIIPPVPDQTSIKVTMFFILGIFRCVLGRDFYPVSAPPLPPFCGSSKSKHI